MFDITYIWKFFPKLGFCCIQSKVILMLGAVVDCRRATKPNWEERFQQSH